MPLPNCSVFNHPLKKLFSERRIFRVPARQRGYRWGEEEWQRIWREVQLLDEGEGETTRNIGYLIFKSIDDDALEVVDGQQLLTTISISLLGIIKNLNRMAEQGIDAETHLKIAKRIKEIYITAEGEGGLPSVRLQLNRSTGQYYANSLIALKPEGKQALGFSEVQLKRAFVWFDNAIAKLWRDTPEANGVAALAERMMSGLHCSTIVADSDTGAYEIIEMLNSRNEPLSLAALFKKHLMEVIDTQGVGDFTPEDVDAQWLKILETLNGLPFAIFLRHFWGSRNATVTKRDLLKIIKGKVLTDHCVQTFLGRIHDAAVDYALLRDPANPQWNRKERDALELLTTIGIDRAMSLLMACHNRFFASDRKTYGLLLQDVATLMLRHHMCSRIDWSLEGTLNNIAQRITLGELYSLEAITGIFTKICPPDENFRKCLQKLSLDTQIPHQHKLASLLLAQMHLGKDSRESVSYKRYATIYIAPWKADGGNKVLPGEMGQRLGNMALIPAKRLGDLDKVSWEDRRTQLANSPWELNRGITKAGNPWGCKEVEERQQVLAERALDIWRIAQ